MKKLVLLITFVLVSGTFQILKAQAIPVIIHVIHGGVAPGTFPNLAQGQINSQVQVLNDDYAGTGYNVANYPSNAFTTWATNSIVTSASKDGLGRIKIANTGITFCLALKDTLGNTLAEPGIDRIDFNTISAPLSGTYTSKNPANSVYNNLNKFQSFIDSYIKANTSWNCSKYYNIWITDMMPAVGLLGYGLYPTGSTLPGISIGTGSRTTDGLWVWAKSFGSSVIFPAGIYQAGNDLGRTATHETGHWLGLLHNYSCPAGNDFCNDTPPGTSVGGATCTTTYPFGVNTCSITPGNNPDGEMFMNFMDRSAECAMYMFTQDQANRMTTAKTNSPYRKFLGTHGLCISVGINEIHSEPQVKLWPNPAADRVRIDISGQGSQEVRISVNDALGKMYLEQKSAGTSFEINTSSLEKGIYLVTVKVEGYSKTIKLLIE